MSIGQADRFVRLPTELLEALLRVRLSGTQWRILLWVIRQTLGWNRNTAAFTWYRIARNLALDRGGVLRAGQKLLRSGILYLDGDQIGVKDGSTLSQGHGSVTPPNETMANVSEDGNPHEAMTEIIARDGDRQRNRCRKSSLFRRTKDSSKDNSKKYRKTHSPVASAYKQFPNGSFSEQQHPAGAARPIPGKYDGLSQN